MLIKKKIINNERKIIEIFLNKKFVDIPDLPSWITSDLIQFWNKNLFFIHYIPNLLMDESLELPSWKDKPSKVFYKKIHAGELENESHTMTGRWILIDGRNKPKKKVPWIRINDVWFLEKIGLNAKNRLKKWHKQLHENEYMIDLLKKEGFGSRFCLTIDEINNLKPSILSFLNINQTKVIRLPFFAEYNYLGNAIYNQWRKTETWEWLEDRLKDGQYLACGSRSVGCVGWEPPEFWSTILTFRPVIEL